MSWKEALDDKLKAFADSEFDYIETRDIKNVSKIDLGCTGIYMECTLIYFEIKNLPHILKEYGRRKAAQAYTMFKEVLSAVTERDEAFVNCYSPKAFLIVYPGHEESIEAAVKGALKITHALSEDFKQYFSDIQGLEFSMGIDHSHILGSKSLSDNSYEHITWFGSAIYKAMYIASECSRPFYVGISSSVYHSLGEELRIAQRRILGIKKTVEMWSKVSYQYDNVRKHLYQTNFKIPLDEA